MEEELDKQPLNTHDILEKEKEKKLREAPILPYMWKKGQSGNPAGRPKGKTMKEYARDLLECQTEEERQEFLHGLPKEIIWKMAEGNPDSKTEETGVTRVLLIDKELAPLYGIRTTQETNGSSQEPNEVQGS